MKNKVIAIIAALALSLNIFLPMSARAVVSPSGNDFDDAGDTAEVYNPTGMTAALADPKFTNIKIMANFTVSSKIRVRRSVTIDLNGKTISSVNPGFKADGVTQKFLSTFSLESGHITIQNGTIAPAMGTGVALDTYYAPDKTMSDILTVNIAKDVTISSPNYYGIYIYDTSYGTTLNFSGKIESRYGIANNGSDRHTTNYLKVNISDGSSIHTIEGAVYVAGYSDWTFGATDIVGTMGVGIKSGIVTMNGTHITANDVAKDPTPGVSGIAGAGSAIQIEEDTGHAGGINLTINGGSYTSLHNPAITQYQKDPSVDADKVEQILIEDGRFTGAPGVSVFSGVPIEDVTINGGEYSSDIKAYASGRSVTTTTIDGKTYWHLGSTKPSPAPGPVVVPGCPNAGVASSREVEQTSSAASAYVVPGLFIAAAASLIYWKSRRFARIEL